MSEFRNVVNVLCGRWTGVALGTLLAVGMYGCGGGSDPLGVTGGGGDNSSGGGSMNTTVDLRAAYDRVNQCGLTIDEVSEIVGARPGRTAVYWDWYQDFFGDKDELRINRELRVRGFPDDGHLRATGVHFQNTSKGFSIRKELCN